MRRLMLVALSLATILTALSCTSTESLRDQDTKEGRILTLEAEYAIEQFKDRDPSIDRFFDSCFGYAVFPSVGKGGIGIGGAHGEGQVFEGGRLIGVSTLSQVTVGLQLGGQEYREIIFFKDRSALDAFTGGNFEFSGQASAVAAKAGAAATADYESGVAVFTTPVAGLMYEASIGGQKFEYAPIR